MTVYLSHFCSSPEEFRLRPSGALVRFEEAALQRAMIITSGSASRVRSLTPGNAKGAGVVVHRLWGKGDSKAIMVLFAQLAFVKLHVETAPKA